MEDGAFFEQNSFKVWKFDEKEPLFFSVWKLLVGGVFENGKRAIVLSPRLNNNGC